MANCNSCNGGCASCGGCTRQLLINEEEIQMLQVLGQIPYLPIARRKDDMTPVCLEEGCGGSLVLQCMEQKGLISLDYDKPLANFDMSAYAAYPVHGSMALTARGQQVLEMLQIQGIEEE